ncbi:MAG: hypothetical protein MJK04_06600 [Psychrosphaera sp.]|nr:hypothetical protein [Psychrosphaera sp.]
MKIQIDEQLLSFIQEIKAEAKSNMQWSEIESCDWFQSESYCGGYEANEQAFCFSYYHPDGPEFWFQFTLDDIEKVELGVITGFTGVEANC